MTGTANAARRGALIIALSGLALATGCSYAHVDKTFPQDVKRLDAASFSCCSEPEKFYPPGLTEIALALGNTLGPKFSEAAYGDYEAEGYPGKLTGKADAEAAILQRLQPFDILLVSNHSYQIGRLMPGRFSHSVINLGTEAQLRRLGLWSDPALVPYHDQIRAGNTMIEAAWPHVQLVSPKKTFEVDQVLIARPTELTLADKRRALERALSVIGKPFNFGLGIDPAGQKFACTGLLDYAMPELGMTHRRVYSRNVVMPDDVAAQTVREERLHFVGYMVGTDTGYAWQSKFALMVRIAAYWGVPGK